ncbi:DUF4902 domain-containing protein [Agarivorans sp.]|uniref:DUF4902 domain-containing protein n=1 Tax=Agarivorans sp. TaxID=1872412 RepID=UPI003D08B2EF
MNKRASRKTILDSAHYTVVPDDDGLIRLTYEQLSVLDLKHVISGLDNINPAQEGLTEQRYGGYTEWLFENVCAITVGWDWHWVWSDGRMHCQVKGFPRSNLQLQEDGFDVSPKRNDQLLLQLIDNMLWQPTTTAAILQRYQESPMNIDYMRSM